MIEGGTVATSIESRTIRKLRLKLLPFLFLLYVVCYLDRTNISIASLTMNEDLGITSGQFGLVFGIFFVGYFLFEIPSNLLLHRIGARIWLARILLSWGAVATLTGFARNVHHLYILRFLLGIAEAGYFPGVCLYLTYWFPKSEQARALALFLVGLPVCNIIGAPLSGYVLDHVHWLGVASWRWLLILQGIPAIVLGFLTYAVLPSWPHEAAFLTTEEKEWIHAELRREDLEAGRPRDHSLRDAFTGRVWHLVLIYLGMMVGRYTISSWAPQIVKSLSAASSNSFVGVLLTIPNLVGLAAMILISRSSDRRLERKYHVAIPAATAACALGVLSVTHSPFVAVALLSLVEIGLMGFLAPFWAMLSEFLSGSAIAAGFALINSVGNLGGFVGPVVVGSIYQRTGSLPRGLIFTAACVLLSFVLMFYLPKRAAFSRVPTTKAG